MAGTVTHITKKGVDTLKGLQHAEDNTILGFFKAFVSGLGKGTLNITKYMKSTAVVAGVVVPAISVSYTLSGAGFGAVSGHDVFVVPGPEVGTGLSFVVVAAILGVFGFYRARLASRSQVAI